MPQRRNAKFEDAAKSSACCSLAPFFSCRCTLCIDLRIEAEAAGTDVRPQSSYLDDSRRLGWGGSLSLMRLQLGDATGQLNRRPSGMSFEFAWVFGYQLSSPGAWTRRWSYDPAPSAPAATCTSRCGGTRAPANTTSGSRLGSLICTAAAGRPIVGQRAQASHQDPSNVCL